MAAFTLAVRNFFLRLFQSPFVVVSMVTTLLRQLRRFLRMKKIITNPPCVLQFASQAKNIINNIKKGWLLRHLRRTNKKKLQNLHRKRSNDWPMMSFIHSGNKIIIYRDSRGNKLDGVELATSLHFKTKTIKSKATFLRTSFFEAADHYISTRTLELYFNSLKQLLLQLQL